MLDTFATALATSIQAASDLSVSWQGQERPTMYRLMVENTVDLIIRFDAAQRRIYVSPSSFEMLGYRPAELLGGSVFDLNHPEDQRHAAMTFAALGPCNGRSDLSFRVRRKDGQFIWVEAQYRYLPDDGSVLAVIRDITARKQAEDSLADANRRLSAANELLQTLSHQDGLTGLANRRRFDESLAEAFRRARRQKSPLSLVMLDVDCFKAYNDRYGHVAGDDCLRRISRAMEGVLRRPDDLAARYGGEEIVALLPATETNGALQRAKLICDAVASLRIEHLGSPHGIATVSAGVGSLMPLDCENGPADLVKAADRALYESKARGKNQVRAGVLKPRSARP